MILSKDKRNKVQLAKFISTDLMLRNSANVLFNYINDIEPEKIIVDFDKVKSITRAFAHQYLLNKKESKKEIIDINISPQINNMFKMIWGNK